MLLPTDDTELNVLKVGVTEKTVGFDVIPPVDLPSSKMDEFCEGFAEILAKKADQENAHVRELRAEGEI
ncbi:hypothetical protein [Actinomadura violacea]|uniref:DUF397 domain-containing protein n=1 Tax=Actinomadura violacea TaxID=2819934 RepID=A0ABS3S568_9ACTN|nr:hypothetical protein [Actinomadura violacea]MBO2464143.1 hypothetical protein [Actinomadura violacea]